MIEKRIAALEAAIKALCDEVREMQKKIKSNSSDIYHLKGNINDIAMGSRPDHWE